MTTIIIKEEVDGANIRGATITCLKHLKRYEGFTMPKNVMKEILLCALKGQGCKEDHLDIAQRDSLYEHLKDKQIDDPYIQLFLEQSKETLRKND